LSKKFIYTLVTILLLIVAIIGFNFYQKIYGKTIIKNTILYVNSTDSLIDIKNNLVGFSKNPSNFLFVASKKNFSKPKSGRYQLTKGMSNNDVVNLIRSGNQTPAKISFNNQDTLEKFAARIAQQLETDSASLLKSFKDSSFLSKNDLTEQSVLQIFIPNSYELYWTISPKKFRNKMLREYHRFWNTSRLEKAKKIKLNQRSSSYISFYCSKRNGHKKRTTNSCRLVLKSVKKRLAIASRPYNYILYSRN
jgi:UPF0755 protein